MSDSVVTVETIGYGARLKESIKGVLFGSALFFGSFCLLWWNEGDIVAEKQALAELEKAVVKTSAVKPLAKNDGKPVHSTGKLASPLQLSDEQFLKPASYLRLTRDVEMYQWVEEEETETSSKAGGSQTKKTTYSYAKEWHEGRNDSSKFHKPEGHTNPPLAFDGNVWTVESASYGGYDGSSVLEHHTDQKPLKLSAKLLTPAAKTVGAELKDDKLHIKAAGKRGVGAGPQLGDVRIGYRATMPGIVSVIAMQSEKTTLSPFVGSNGKQKYLVEAGKKAAPAMIGTARDAAKMTAMILRAVGFFLMWFGLALIASPFGVLLDVIPFFGSVTRGVTAIVSFLASAVLSTITIVVAMIAHNPIALAVVVAAAIAGTVYFFKSRADAKARRVTGNQAQPHTQSRAA